MTVVESRSDLWEVLAGRAAGASVSPADELLSRAVRERLNLDRATPCLRADVEAAELTNARGATYVMLRSPSARRPSYVRLTPEEWILVQRMDGRRTVARLISEFTRISGRLAAEQVTRLAADLAAAGMVDQLSPGALSGPDVVPRKRFPHGLGSGLLAILRGRPLLAVGVDPLVRVLHMLVGRPLFTQASAAVGAFVAVAGTFAFGQLWIRGDQPIFYAGNTGHGYLAGALVLLGLYSVVLAIHEFARALMVKHAGRRVSVAGVRLYAGLPSIYFDTSDVWMASRTGRIAAAVAGPAGVLVLAGGGCLVALVWPASAAWAVKFAFVAYLHVLLCLNPFVPRDGYQLLVDWLEVSNLRARALVWVDALVRRRRPRFADLDAEARLVALYGMIGIAWLLITVNVGWRIFADRLSGLVTGLWYGDWTDRALLIAIVVGLAAALLGGVGGRALRWLDRLRQQAADSQVHTDFPYRLDVLRACALGGLPPEVLVELAREARWLRPGDGRPLLERGGRVQQVYIVVSGVAEARRPGDPGGVIRQRVAPGGVIGLASAVTGSPASYAWYNVGATLLAIPVPVFTAAIGRLPTPRGANLAELEDLLDETPQFAALSAEAYLGLTVHAEMLELLPGEPVVLPNPSDAALVGSGVVERYDGRSVQRGTVLGPYGNDKPSEAGVARTPARVWRLPGLTALSPLPVGPVGLTGVGGVHRTPAASAADTGLYPPLAAPPWPPSGDISYEADGRFEGRMRWLLGAVVIFGLLLGAANVWYGPAWAELPPNRVLLTVSAGAATVDVGGRFERLAAGDERYLASGDQVDVVAGSAASLQYRGGAIAVLCAGSSVLLGDLGLGAGQPSAAMTLRGGRLLADTTGTSSAYRPLALTVRTGRGAVATGGAARLAVDPDTVQLARGSAALDGQPVDGGGAVPTCADGVVLPEPSVDATSNPASTSPPSVMALPPVSGSASEATSASTPASPSASASSKAPTSASPNPTSLPPQLVKPVVSRVTVVPGQLCGGHAWAVAATVTDADPANLHGTVTFSPGTPPTPIPMTRSGNVFSATMPVLSLPGDVTPVVITVTVSDNRGNSGTGSASVQWDPSCVSASASPSA